MKVNTQVQFTANVTLDEEDVNVLAHMFGYAIDRTFYEHCSHHISEERLKNVVQKMRNELSQCHGRIRNIKDFINGKTT